MSFSGAAPSRLLPSACALPRLAKIASVRYQSNVPSQPDPKTKAQSILDALPGNSLISKTAILSSAAGVSIAAISSEIYVVNNETVVALCLITIYGAVAKYLGPLYGEWANTQINKIRDILQSARQDHVKAVEDRIDSVSQMSSVVDVTKALFEVSKVRPMA